MSLSMTISFEKCVFGAAMSTASPSKSFKRPCEDISFSLQRKSFKKVISTCSTPTHAKLFVEELETNSESACNLKRLSNHLNKLVKS